MAAPHLFQVALVSAVACTSLAAHGQESKGPTRDGDPSLIAPVDAHLLRCKRERPERAAVYDQLAEKIEQSTLPDFREGRARLRASAAYAQVYAEAVRRFDSMPHSTLLESCERVWARNAK